MSKHCQNLANLQRTAYSAPTRPKRAGEWTWVPDQDGTPDKPITRPPTAADAKRNQAAAPDASGDADGSTQAAANDAAYTAEKLARWKPGQLKELLNSLGLDASGCAEKKDIVDKIMRHPGGPAAAAEAAAARGDPVAVPAPKARVSGQEGASGSGSGLMDGDGTKPAVEETDASGAAAAADADGEEQDGFIGMTLADYMGRPTEEADNNIANGGRNGGARPGGAGGGRPGAVGGETRGGGGGGGPSSVTGSTASGRADLSSAASGRGGRVVRLAPAHIAPPSRPAPEWMVVMQVGVWEQAAVLCSKPCFSTKRMRSCMQNVGAWRCSHRFKTTRVAPEI